MKISENYSDKSNGFIKSEKNFSNLSDQKNKKADKLNSKKNIDLH